jgi:hypothetical protein
MPRDNKSTSIVIQNVIKLNSIVTQNQRSIAQNDKEKIKLDLLYFCYVYEGALSLRAVIPEKVKPKIYILK